MSEINTSYDPPLTLVTTNKPSCDSSLYSAPFKLDIYSEYGPLPPNTDIVNDPSDSPGQLTFCMFSSTTVVSSK